MENITGMLTNSVPNFSGEGTNIEQNLSNFLSIAEQFIKQFSQQHSNIMFILKLKIVGEAKHVINKSPTNTFNELKRVLTNQYYSPDQVIIAYENLKQADYESVSSYSYRFQDIYSRYKEEMGEPGSISHEKRAKKKFRLALKSNELRQETRSAELSNSSLDEFIQEVITFEKSHLSEGDNRGSSNQTEIQTEILQQMMELLKTKNNENRSFRSPRQSNFQNNDNNGRFRNNNRRYDQNFNNGYNNNSRNNVDNYYHNNSSGYNNYNHNNNNFNNQRSNNNQNNGNNNNYNNGSYNNQRFNNNQNNAK